MKALVKFSGKVVADDTRLKSMLNEIISLKKQGIELILVHGGGNAISAAVESAGGRNRFIDGMRVTDALTLKIVEEELAAINNSICSYFFTLGIKCCGYDGTNKILKTIKKEHFYNGELVDLGFVGDPIGTETEKILSNIKYDVLPVITPIGHDVTDKCYNINADTAAACIAADLKVDWLFLLSDVDGIYINEGENKEYLSELSIHEIDKLVIAGEIYGGMLPKVACCRKALDSGVQNVVIANGLRENIMGDFFSGKYTKGTIIKL